MNKLRERTYRRKFKSKEKFCFLPTKMILDQDSNLTSKFNRISSNFWKALESSCNVVIKLDWISVQISVSKIQWGQNLDNFPFISRLSMIKIILALRPPAWRYENGIDLREIRKHINNQSNIRVSSKLFQTNLLLIFVVCLVCRGLLTLENGIIFLIRKIVSV